MAESGFCGISSHNTVSRLRISSIHTSKTGALPYHSSGRVPTAHFPSFRHGRNANEKSSKVRTSSSKGWKYTYLHASAPLFAGECGSSRIFLPTIVKPGRIVMSQQAAKEDKNVYTGYPPMQKKPRWWWRVLTCFPYLISFHITWLVLYSILHWWLPGCCTK
ncbi:hypothetical protein SUGI_0153290 [Cryptomeria japonica]|nr:hypothetical protein SUGI_0153290 [Cryptomeria japonica]